MASISVTIPIGLNESAAVNLFYKQWTTNELVVSVTRGGGRYDLTGATILWVAGDGPLLSKGTVAGTLTVDAPPTAGVFRFTITAADSLLFTAGDLAAGVNHQCKIQDALGDVYLAFEGVLRFDDTMIVAM